MSKTTTDSLPSLFTDQETDEPVLERRCVDCAAVAPGTRTAYTLISAKHGWRLQRDGDAGGMVWLCPGCANVRKGRADASPHARRSGVGEHSIPARAPTTSVRPADAEESRGTGAVDMLSNLCRSMLEALRPRAGTNPVAARLLDAVGAIRAELDLWVADPPTAKRRSEVLSALLSLNRDVNELR